MKRISIVFGTRPEAIKMAPVIQQLRKVEEFEVSVCFTGQHKEMVLPLIDFFDLKIDSMLDVMQPNQSLATLTSTLVRELDSYVASFKPDIVLVQGDTTTAFCAALVSFYRKIKVGHIEAGLRTHTIDSPFPEEFNRQVIGKVTAFHFVPTNVAKRNLLDEGVPSESIYLTGNTVIDALQFAVKKIDTNSDSYKVEFDWLKADTKMVLITGHRRENFGVGFENICKAISTLAQNNPDCLFVYPVHLNPNVQEPVNRILNGLQNIKLIPPADYISFTQLMEKSFFILTDSGGVQEEAPSLNKPILVMRESTERMEVVDAGAAVLVGTDPVRIVNYAQKLINDDKFYKSMANVANPYGNGKAAEEIASILLKNL
ncbi:MULTISPECIES: non-hydrolyzing UDP-N-acetylglucosamine 2-epimerase [unclassified Paraflavitalea]|uniref:non-hydrolyzing UDP-N-acetylglucosamine 2-epimerase n=1 Tax=unclassified Paraflavitalea TaxID=2798305 RepID=UPI003D352E39